MVCELAVMKMAALVQLSCWHTVRICLRHRWGHCLLRQLYINLTQHVHCCWWTPSRLCHQLFILSPQ